MAGVNDTILALMAAGPDVEAARNLAAELETRIDDLIYAYTEIATQADLSNTKDRVEEITGALKVSLDHARDAVGALQLAMGKNDDALTALRTA